MDKGDAETKSGAVVGADVVGVEYAIPGIDGVVGSTLNAVWGNPAELVGRDAGSVLGVANGTRADMVPGGNAGGLAVTG